MANTTFSGAVRSENNFKLVSKDTTTGLIQDRTKISGLKDTRRYYLEEYFLQRPILNADLDAASKNFAAPSLTLGAPINAAAALPNISPKSLPLAFLYPRVSLISSNVNYSLAVF